MQNLFILLLGKWKTRICQASVKQQEQLKERLSKGVIVGVSFDAIALEVCGNLDVNNEDIFKRAEIIKILTL